MMIKSIKFLIVSLLTSLKTFFKFIAIKNVLLKTKRFLLNRFLKVVKSVNVDTMKSLMNSLKMCVIRDVYVVIRARFNYAFD